MTGRCGERILAWTAVAAVHVVLAALLLQVPSPLKHDDAAETALEIVWIPAPHPQARQVRQTRTAQRVQERRPAPTALPATVRVFELETESDPGSKSLSAVFIEQARLPAPEADRPLASDPFADRVVRLPGRDARTFRMRPPPSLAARVAAVGRMFGGGDDPCRSARDSINELSQAGDSRALRDVLDYEKRHCR